MNKNQIFIIKTKACEGISKLDILLTIEKKKNTEFEYFFANENLLKKFNDGEISINLSPEKNFFSDPQNFHPEKVCTAIIFSSICEPVNDNLLEVLIISDALKRSGITKIKLVAFYLGYTRQDRRINFYKNHQNEYFQNLEPITSKLVFNLIESSGISEINLIDAHFLQIDGFANTMQIKIFGYEFLLEFVFEAIFKIFLQNYEQSFSNLDQILIFFHKICKIRAKQKYCNFIFDQDLKSQFFFEFSENLFHFQKFFFNFTKFLFCDFKFVGPDAGSLKKIRNCASLMEDLIFFIAKIFNFELDINQKIDVCFIEKIRFSPGSSNAMSITGNVLNANLLILDDILDSGSTLISAVKILKESGCAKSISAFITHPILSLDCKEKIISSKELDFLFTTDSISNEKHKNLHKKFIIFKCKNLLDYFL